MAEWGGVFLTSATDQLGRRRRRGSRGSAGFPSACYSQLLIALGRSLSTSIHTTLSQLQPLPAVLNNKLRYGLY